MPAGATAGHDRSAAAERAIETRPRHHPAVSDRERPRHVQHLPARPALRIAKRAEDTPPRVRPDHSGDAHKLACLPLGQDSNSRGGHSTGYCLAAPDLRCTQRRESPADTAIWEQPAQAFVAADPALATAALDSLQATVAVERTASQRRQPPSLRSRISRAAPDPRSPTAASRQIHTPRSIHRVGASATSAR